KFTSTKKTDKKTKKSPAARGRRGHKTARDGNARSAAAVLLVFVLVLPLLVLILLRRSLGLRLGPRHLAARLRVLRLVPLRQRRAALLFARCVRAAALLGRRVLSVTLLVRVHAAALFGRGGLRLTLLGLLAALMRLLTSLLCLLLIRHRGAFRGTRGRLMLRRVALDVAVLLGRAVAVLGHPLRRLLLCARWCALRGTLRNRRRTVDVWARRRMMFGNMAYEARAFGEPRPIVVVRTPVRVEREAHDGDADARTGFDDEYGLVVVFLFEEGAGYPAAIGIDGDVAPRIAVDATMNVDRCARVEFGDLRIIGVGSGLQRHVVDDVAFDGPSTQWSGDCERREDSCQAFHARPSL